MYNYLSKYEIQYLLRRLYMSLSIIVIQLAYNVH